MTKQQILDSLGKIRGWQEEIVSTLEQMETVETKIEAAKSALEAAEKAQQATREALFSAIQRIRDTYRAKNLDATIDADRDYVAKLGDYVDKVGVYRAKRAELEYYEDELKELDEQHRSLERAITELWKSLGDSWREALKSSRIPAISMGLYAVLVRPIVTPIPRSDDLLFTTLNRTSKDPFSPLVLTDQAAARRESATDDKRPMSFRFVQPCWFPLASHSFQDRAVVVDSGLLVYEGMELLFSDDGRYELRFMTDPVSVPVTLRLSLHLTSAQWSDVHGSSQPVAEHLLTLPPVEIQPQFSGGKLQAAPQTIRTVGFSPLIAHRFDELRKVVEHQAVVQFFPELSMPCLRRSGTARFGWGAIK